MASLLLAHRVFTLVPASIDDPDPNASRQAAAQSPWYSRFVETWSWTVPLWEEGVLSSGCKGDDLAAEMRAVAVRLQNDEQFSSLRPLLRDELYDSDHTYLSSLGADLVKGGPDPGITVPLSAALDRFARRHECCVARAQAVSVVQKAEANYASTVFAIAVPVLLQASADLLLAARELLEPQLEPLRERLDEIVGVRSPVASPDRELASLAAAYAEAFDSHAAELLGTLKDEVRAIVGSVVITGVSMPADVVLRSSLTAVEKLVAPLGRPRAKSAPETTTLPMPVKSADAGSVVSLVMKPMGESKRGR